MTIVDPGRLADGVLSACRAQAEPALRAAVAGLPEAVRRIASYHIGWTSADGTPAPHGSGKAIRPALALLACSTVAGRPEPAVPAAVAVELVHDFSLLHDDVMDGDLTRRHRPTAWSVFGVGPAVLAGDALLTLAMDVLAVAGHRGSGQAVRMLGSSVQELVDGQISDLAFEQRADVQLEECLAMAEAKTGALLGCACALGAVLGGGTPEQIRALERFGRQLGLAFQLVDDLLGIWGAPATTGKPVRADLRSRKKSLPVVAALVSGTPAGRALGELYHAGHELSDGELERAAGLVEDAGGRQWCRERADALHASAVALLPADPAPDGPASQLRLLADLMARRDH